MSEKYDVVIIGAGIGGLVCGCYLTKAGLKVLIVEQQNKPGGYCTSFERDGYKFDVGAHCFGSLREEGVLFKILNELELLNNIHFLTCEYTDRIIMPDRIVLFRKESNKTREELISHFHNEKENIERFFDFILCNDFLQLVSNTKGLAFSEILDNFFTDYKLKAILSIPLINIGLAPSEASALISIILYREFIFDGGYYPEGGIQILSTSLLNKFKELGGKFCLSTKVTKIITKGNRIEGIITDKDGSVRCGCVVSNADAILTFDQLLDCKSKEADIVNKLRPSISVFMVYFGLKQRLDHIPKHFTTGIFSTYDIESCYKNTNILQTNELKYLFLIFPTLIDCSLAPENKSIVRTFLAINFFNIDIWEIAKKILYPKVVNKVTKIIPDIENNIEVKEIAGPDTFNKFTSNSGGSILGWASLPSQVEVDVFPCETSIENLFTAGHWTTNGIGQSGISVVALSGQCAAQKIIRKVNKGYQL